MVITSEADYEIALIEASWFEVHYPAKDDLNNLNYVGHLIKALTEYEEANGLESYELRELKCRHDKGH